MPTLRTFIAAEVSDDVRRRAGKLIESLAMAGAKVSWVDPAQLHLTIKFLGDVEITRTADICRSVAEAAARHEPFPMHLAGAGAFPRAERPRTLWLGVDEGAAEMTTLAADLDEALRPLGFHPERRRFTPHLTLGRVRDSQRLAALAAALQEQADFDGGRLRVEELIVFSSHLERGGARHERIGGALLGG